MSLIVAWVLFPLAFIVVSAGLGLLVERAAGGRLPGVLLIPVGTAGLVAVSQLPAYWDWSAELTSPLIVLLALVGLVLGFPRLRALALDPWALAAAAGVFAVFAAPIVLSGSATFAGYTVLGDTSIHFIGADHILHHGRHFGGLAPSSYEFSLANYYGAGGYPSGGPTSVGVLAQLVSQDVAWVFQPFLSLLVASMALCLYALLQPLVAFAPLRAFVAFIAAQPALVLAYALQGSIKEIGSVWAVALLGALLPAFASHPEYGVRRAIPLAVAAAAAVAFVGPAAGVWVAPFAVAALAASLWDRRRRWWPLTVAEAAVFAGVLLVLTLPSLVDLRSYLDVAGGVVTAQNELGNLFGPLDRAQIFGSWLAGDYRLEPTGRNLTLTHVFIAVTIVSGVVGIVWLVRRRALWPAVYVGVSLLAWLYVTYRGSPWADAKALMIVSPAVLLLAMLGPAALYSGGRRIEGGVLAAFVAAGVLASNALAYHDVSLAPRDRLGELERIGHRIDGQGPTLYTEFEEFGKHFLREGDPEGSSEGWQRRLGPLRNGQFARQGFSNDLDEFPLDYVRYYRTIVVRRSPAASRPPAPYRRTYAGRFYDVWERPPGSQRSIVEHASLGAGFQRGAAAPCSEVERLAAKARQVGGRLAYSPAPRSIEIVPAQTAYPPAWFIDGSEGHILRPRGPGKIETSARVRSGGRYDVWVMGSFARGFDVLIDGRRLGRVADELSGRGQYDYAGTEQLDSGRHIVTLVRGGGSPVPGDGVIELLGPVLLAPRLQDEYAVRFVGPARAPSLCGRWLDWIEVVRVNGA